MAHVFIKPTGVECGAGPYDLRRGLFRPNSDTVRLACGQWLGLAGPEVDNAVVRAERLAAEFSLNILGGLFLLGVERSGLSHCHVARVDVTEREFVGVLYPDLAADRFSDASSPKIRNNLGVYSVHRVEGGTADVHGRLAELKKTFRLSLVDHVEAIVIVNIKDHVVHVPDDVTQDLLHLAAAGVGR